MSPGGDKVKSLKMTSYRGRSGVLKIVKLMLGGDILVLVELFEEFLCLKYWRVGRSWLE
jgi:hypothetical protein